MNEAISMTQPDDTSITQKVGEWSFEVRADGSDLYFYAAHESQVPPVSVDGEPTCEPMEWATRLTVEEGWA